MAECALRRRERCREKGRHEKSSSGMPATGMILQSDRLIGSLPEGGYDNGTVVNTRILWPWGKTVDTGVSTLNIRRQLVLPTGANYSGRIH